MKVIQVKKNPDTYHMEYDKFFCCCEYCGSMTWMNSIGESNELDEDGDMLINQDIWEDGVQGEYYCHNCEKPLKPIMFNKISKKERIKIYKMTNETRANWMKSCEIIDELEKQNNDDKKFRRKIKKK